MAICYVSYMQWETVMTEEEKKKIEAMASMAGDVYPVREDVPEKYWNRPLYGMYPEYWEDDYDGKEAL